MGVYKKAIITDAGEALRARAVAGEASMQFSHAKTSTYVYPDGTDLTKLTDLQEIRQTVIPSNVQIANDTLISVRSLFGNEQINEAYLIQNVGVYATDGENEILFAVCQAITPDQMPAYDGVAPSSFIYNVQLTVSQATQISLVVNTAGTATTQDVLELEQKKVNGNGGDISETVIAATEKSQAEYPVPAAGDSAKTVLGKVQKFFGDLRNWMTGVCLLGQIVNNCVTDNAKLPLSAAQGKVLMDLYNVLNTNAKKHRHIVAVETVTVNLSPQLSDPNINNGRLMAGKFIDLTENLPEHDSIVPVPFLVATGWFTGGVEIRALTKNSITVRLLNGTDKDSGGYASFKLLFFE